MKKNMTIVTLALLIIGAASIPASAQPVRSEVDAKAVVQAHITKNRNPNLRVGPARDVGRVYEVEVVTRKGTLVDRILVDKEVGHLRSLYGEVILSKMEARGGGRAAVASGGGPVPPECFLSCRSAWGPR